MSEATLTVTDQHRAAARRYPMTVVVDDAGTDYYVEIPAFPYVTGVGDTPEEAVAEAVEGLAGVLALGEEYGQQPPEPLARYSGQIQLRMPASLHRALAARAQAESASLNATAIMLLTRALDAEDRITLPPRRRPRRAPAA